MRLRVITENILRDFIQGALDDSVIQLINDAVAGIEIPSGRDIEFRVSGGFFPVSYTPLTLPARCSVWTLGVAGAFNKKKTIYTQYMRD